MAKPVERLYSPKNPQKYVGANHHRIILRSSWELRFAIWLDLNPKVLQWSSESVFVPYNDPVKGTSRRYFIDFYVVVQTPEGHTKTSLIEIKPYHQTLRPLEAGKKKKRYLYELATYATNSAKWESAKKFAQARGWDFKIITEREMGIV